VRASEVTPRRVEWLMWPYFPLGKLSVVAGQMGQAKSLLTAWLAAYTTPLGVVMLSAEDDAEDTIRPRLEAAGADLDRVWIDTEAKLDVDRLGKICDELTEVKLITIDPVQAYMPSSVNTWKGQDVRLALEPVRRLAAERSLAVVLVQHLNRRSDADPLARIADSQGVPQLARSVLIWGPDPSDPEGDHGTMKVLTKAKANLARSKASATFTIVEKQVTHHIKAPALEKDEVVADQDTRTATDEAVEWLRELLADGPMQAKEAKRQARQVGIADRTLDRAKRRAGVRSESTRGENGISGWTWSLGDQAYSSGALGVVGALGNQGNHANTANTAKDANTNAVPLVAAVDPESNQSTTTPSGRCRTARGGQPRDGPQVRR
jgi:putative DNA primase/helicase